MSGELKHQPADGQAADGLPASGLGRCWLVTNLASGSVDEALLADIEARLASAGVALLGRSFIPDDVPPSAERLDAQRVETLLVLAGDGTVRAVAASLRDWGGRLLVLPGGTMNLLARQLHGDATAGEVLERLLAEDGDPRLAYPTLVETAAGEALCAVMAGPLARWADAREAVRDRRLARLLAAVRRGLASLTTQGLRIQAADGTRLRGRGRLVVVEPLDGKEPGLRIAMVPGHAAREALGIGLAWLQGDWRASRGVTTREAVEVALLGSGAINLLLDGEPARLPGPVRLRAARSPLAFIATLNP